VQKQQHVDGTLLAGVLCCCIGRVDDWCGGRSTGRGSGFSSKGCSKVLRHVKSTCKKALLL